MSDDMPAGPEIDLLVARQVMGREAGIIDGRCRLGRQDAAAFGTRCFWEDSSPWSPSTNIADAWQVVERMSEIGDGLTIMPLSTGSWRVTSRAPFTGAVVYADTAPLAICRAALKVVGG